MLGLGLGMTSRGTLQRSAAVAAWTPYTGAAIDMDFVAQKYWWGGALKTTSDFTTYVLGGATFDPTGITCTNTTDITLSLSGLGTFIPGALATAVYNTSASPGATRGFGYLDDGSSNERVTVSQGSTAQLSFFVVDGGVTQASPNGGAPSQTINARHGIAGSYALNDVKSSFDGIAGTADVVATMPAPTTLRVGRLFGAQTPIGAVSRIVVYTIIKTQAELNALSIALRDNVVI